MSDDFPERTFKEPKYVVDEYYADHSDVSLSVEQVDTRSPVRLRVLTSIVDRRRQT